jgi:hypothetical protein
VYLLVLLILNNKKHPRYSWECQYCPFSMMCPLLVLLILNKPILEEMAKTGGYQTVSLSFTYFKPWEIYRKKFSGED